MFCASVLAALGLSIQLRNATASVVLTVIVNFASGSALIMIEKKHVVSVPLMEFAGIRTHKVSVCPARLRDGRRVTALILTQRVHGNFVLSSCLQSYILHPC